MGLFLTLLLAHLIADFPLQAGWVYKFKTRCTAGVVLHSGIHVAVTALLVSEPAVHWPALIVLGLTHFAIDWLKLRLPSRAQTPGFLLDQLAHLSVLAVLVLGHFGLEGILPEVLLYPGTAYALIPAVSMFAWVYANDRGCEDCLFPDLMAWLRLRMLTLSKATGIPLVMGVSAMMFVAGR